MTNYYIPIIYIVPLISVDGQASPRLFIAPEIRHKKSPIGFMLSSIESICFRSYSNRNRQTTTGRIIKGNY